MNQDLATGLDSLHLAVTYNRTDIVNLLVQRYGADPNVKNNEGINSFHLCVHGSHFFVAYYTSLIPAIILWCISKY